VCDALVVWAATTAALGVLGLLRPVAPFVAENLLAFVAIVFLYVPLGLLWRRREDPLAFGITTRAWPRGLATAGVVMVVVFPTFCVGYHLWHGVWGGHPPELAPERLARWSPALEGRPADLATSADVHLWAAGGRLVVWGGGRLAPPPVPVSGDIVCRVSADRGCARPLAPEERHLAVQAPSVERLRLGEYAEPATLPLTADRGHAWWWTFLLVQLGLVALPEEVLYRGYLQTRLNARWRPRWRLLGATVGPGLFVAAGLFALGHLAIDPGPQRLAVFFPGLLFGWLRERTGTVVAPVVVHGLSNVLIRAVASFYFG
jgi:membrane protease YdiL (CAAX protease family)